MTLFAWQKPYEIQWTEEDNVMYIRSGRGKKQFWLPPFARKDGSFVKGLDRMKEWFSEHGYPFDKTSEGCCARSSAAYTGTLPRQIGRAHV